MDDSIQSLDRASRDLILKIKTPGIPTIRPHFEGGNNKVFIVEIDGTSEYVLKQYFRHESDTRNRLFAEWTFLKYATESGISCVPRPIVADVQNGIAIFEYIDGKKILLSDLSENHVIQALDFFLALNTCCPEKNRAGLPPASEACFSIHEHLTCVRRRIKALLEIPQDTDIDRSALEFVRSELLPIWETVEEECLDLEKTGIIPICERQPEKNLCISPSDFGFHNALLTSPGQLVFLDFEYAGWDDPVKMICDFFCQPEIPVPHSYLPMFSERVFGQLENPEKHRQRLRKLLPVHQIKWCCIMLNEFLPLGRARRMHAHSDLNIAERKQIQLLKAKKQLYLSEL